MINRARKREMNDEGRKTNEERRGLRAMNPKNLEYAAPAAPYDFDGAERRKSR
jgi:hypothetical protein